MPGYRVPTPAISLTASTNTTLLQLASGSSRRVTVREAWLSSNSVTASDVAMLIEWMTQSTAGTTPTGTITPVAEDPAEPASLFTAAYGPYATDPTAGTDVESHYFSPIGTLFTYQIPLGFEIKFAISSRWGLRANSPQAETVRTTLVTFE